MRSASPKFQKPEFGGGEKEKEIFLCPFVEFVAQSASKKTSQN